MAAKIPMPAVQLPEPSADVLASIEATIRELTATGFRPRIIIDRESQTVLDGAVTLAICERDGIPYDVLSIDVANPTEARLRLAFARRSASESVRAMTVVAELGSEVASAAAKRRQAGKRSDQVTDPSPGHSRGKTVEILAEIAGVGTTIIGLAQRVLRHDRDKSTDLAERVRRGELTLAAAIDELVKTTGGAKSHALAGGNVRSLPEDERRERDRRFTPSIIRDPYRALVGEDFIDVATEILPDGGNPMKAPHALTEADDGIIADWGPLERPAFCNKPNRLRAPFLARCLREGARGRHVTYLETDDVSTFVAQTALRHCRDLIACSGRPNYGKPNGDVDNHPNFGTILYGIGGEIAPMASNGLGVALIPVARVEAMLRVAIASIRGGSSDAQALVAAHLTPGIQVPEHVLERLANIRPAADEEAA